ncbi:hypothetical protein ACFVAD_11095 [Sutcliffiella sp. NPDC057660]|uniref:hypothetical protein n=1 Tax=Sutcliffiella sp. NPDC057660 TaxID=3346199 RepID=UPI003698E5E2
MILAFFITFAVSILILSFLHRYRRRFTAFQLVLLFLVASYLCQNTFYKLFSPYDRISITDNLWAKISIKLHFGVILPVLLIGIIFMSRSNNKLTISFSILGWAAFIVASEKYYLFSGILKKNGENWFPQIDFIFALIVIFMTFVIKKYLYRLLMRERLQT